MNSWRVFEFSRRSGSTRDIPSILGKLSLNRLNSYGRVKNAFEVHAPVPLHFFTAIQHLARWKHKAASGTLNLRIKSALLLREHWSRISRPCLVRYLHKGKYVRTNRYYGAMLQRCKECTYTRSFVKFWINFPGLVDCRANIWNHQLDALEQNK